MTKEQTFDHPPRGHVALLAYDSVNDRFQVIHVDASGLLQVDVAAVADRQVNAHGYDGAAWRKQPLAWGFTSRWSELGTGTSTGGAATNAVTAAVPAGYVYVLENWSIMHNDTVNRSAFLTLAGGVGAPYLDEQAAMVPNVYTFDLCRITLQAGDSLQFTVWALASGKVCYVTAWGYKMKVNM